MMRSLFTAAILGLALSAPAYAAEMAPCDEASIMKINEAIEADTDPAMKKEVEMAMKQVEKAEMAMKDGKTEDCSTHLGMAKEELKMQ